MRRILAMLLILLVPAIALADKTLTLTFVGDCTIGGEERLKQFDYSFDGYLRKEGYGYFFKKMLPILEADDLTVANLEGVFINWANTAVEKTYNFRGTTDYTDVLKQGSVEAVNISNNHILDYGYDGIRHTVKALEGAGINWFGTNQVTQQSWIYEKDGLKIGFVGMELSYWYYKHRTVLKEQIEALRAEGCQVVIGTMHGGVEYKKRHQRDQQDFARAMLDYGADIVIGHHPHVLQGIEVREGKTICYSIGNFVFGGNSKIRAPYTALFQFTLSFADDCQYLGHQLNIIPALPSGEKEFNNYQPILASGEDAEAVMAQIQYDTAFSLKPYVEGVGAMQDYVPAITQ